MRVGAVGAARLVALDGALSFFVTLGGAARFVGMNTHAAPLLIVFALVACDAAERPPVEVSSSSSGLVDGCVAFRERAHACADDAITVMIEERARHQPKIAAALEAPDGLAELRAVGIEELAADGGGPLEARRAACEAVAKKVPAAARPHVDAMEACLEREGCGAFAECFRAPFGALVELQSRPRAL